MLEEVTGGALILEDCCPYTDRHCETWPPASPGERRPQKKARRLVLGSSLRTGGVRVSC